MFQCLPFICRIVPMESILCLSRTFDASPLGLKLIVSELLLLCLLLLVSLSWLMFVLHLLFLIWKCMNLGIILMIAYETVRLLLLLFYLHPTVFVMLCPQAA